MRVNLDNISIQQIIDLGQASDTFSVTIEKPVEPSKLKALNDVLQDSGDKCKIVLVVDLKKKGTPELISNLGVLTFLTNVKCLAILSNSSEEVENIDVISNIKDIEELSLSGFFKKSISLTPLEKFKNLKILNFEFGLNKSQSKIINALHSLSSFAVQSIDLNDLIRNENLENFKITKSLKNHDLLTSLFPNLKKLFLADCKSIEDFSFITKLIHLEKISLNYMKQLIEFPKLDTLENIVEIELLEAKNIKSIDNILDHPKLEKLSVTDGENLEIKDFEKLIALKNLKIVYTRFSNQNKTKDFNALAIKNNWINKHSSVL